MNSPHSPWIEKELIKQLLSPACGACAAGIVVAGPVEDTELRAYNDWIAQGRAAGMDYMSRNRELRACPGDALLPGLRSVVIAAFPYGPQPQRHPMIADYALGEDYHTALRRRLEPAARMIEEAFPGCNTRIGADTLPILEKYWARRAGLGFIGKNSLLIVPGVGSKVFLAEILTDAPLQPIAPREIKESCGACRRCIEACPGGALGTGPGVDCRRCLSYHTIENRDEALPEWVNLRGRRIYGCDICQDVCPFNRDLSSGAGALPEFRMRPEYAALRDAEAWAGLSNGDCRRLFAGSAILRARPAMLRRNAQNFSNFGGVDTKES